MSGIIYSHYQILGVSEYASSDDIRAAYKSLAKKYHPDKHGGAAFYEEHFKKINEAYQILSDPQKRTRYDLQRHYRYTEPVKRPAAARQHQRPRNQQYRPATPPAPEGMTLAQLRLVFYVIAGMAVFALLIIQFYGWMNRLASEDYNQKGISLENEGMHSAAYQSFATALDFNPENSDAWYHKGVLAHTHLRNNVAAIVAFNFAIEYNPNPDWKIYFYKGLCHLELKEPRDALFSFDKARHLPGCPDSIHTRIGDAHFLNHEYNKAIESYTTYLNLHPTNIENLIKRGLCHHILNRYVLAMHDYELAIGLDPQNAAAYYYRAQLKFTSGDRRGGTQDLDTSAALQYRSAIRLKREMENQERLDSIVNNVMDSVTVQVPTP